MVRLTLVEKAVAIVASEPGKAFDMLGRAARDTRHPHREAAFARLVELSRRGGDARLRRYALHCLGGVGDRRAAPILREALSDPELADARLLVETALGSLGG